MDSRRAPLATTALAAASILAVTLMPDGRVVNAGQLPRFANEPSLLADLLRNLILFVPLGIGLAWSRIPARRALVAAAVLSASVELAQSVVPGRHPNPIDCIANVAGVALAFAVFRTAPGWLHPPAQRARRLAFWASAAAAAALASTGVLLAPAPSGAIFYGHRPPQFDDLAPYTGTVVRASIDDVEIPSGRIPDSDRIRMRLRGDHALRVDALSGAPPEGLAALVVISDEQSEILLLGQDGDDLVYRFRTRGQAIGLETATVRLPRALHGVGPGDQLGLTVQRAGADLCFGVDGVVDCGYGFTVGDGWLLLAPDYQVLTTWRPIVDPAWLAMLFLPLGYWGRNASPATWALAAAALLVVPAATALRATPMSQLASAGFGAALGMATRRLRFAAVPGSLSARGLL